MTSTTEVNRPIIVVVSGGGPVGLTFSLHLTMMMGKHVKIIIYEGRWFVDQQGKIRWQGEEEGRTRRDQVVTLQDHVIEQMPEYIKEGLFQNINERVWPTSRNIPIREVEDRLFDLIQPFVRSGQIELITENLHEQSECLIKGNFDILVGADGSNSFVRRYCNIQMISEGLEYACGVAYNIPNHVPSSEEPLHQALNCILTISQTRYLVNSSTSRRGYLNIRLVQDEYNELQNRLEIFQSRKEPLDLLDFNKCPQSPIWTIIRQGLHFFKIPSNYVFRVVPIEINVRHASIVVRELRYEINRNEQEIRKHDEKKYKTALVFLAGDAAMCVHFWPGRGMNSGMKSAIALARNILRSCTINNSINIRRPFRFLDFLDYEGFMARLRAREQQGRSLRVLINPIDISVEASYYYAHLNHCYEKYTKNLIRKLQETRKRLEANPEWPHKSRLITDDELQFASKCIEPQAVAQLSLANPWPTREMSGVEVLAEDIFPYDCKKFLPAPTVTGLSLQRPPSTMIRYSFHILWIIGDKKIESIENLIKDIQNSQNTPTLSTYTDCDYEMTIVKTIEDAQQWIKTNQELIQKPHIRFKVVTRWKTPNDKAAIDVIRAIRSEISQVSVLIWTNKLDEIQAALEFPNVTVTNKKFEVKEFVGGKQEAQWNAGCRVSHIQNNEMSSHTSSSSNFRTHDTSRIPSLKPLLLWIVRPENDPKTTNEIKKNHPTLEIIFKSTYKDAEEYLNKNLREIQEREKFITICQGCYRKEDKYFTDVAQLFRNLNLGTKSLGVYTKSKTALLEQKPDPPKSVEIFDELSGLLAFINRHLKD
ncbi:unnamed protein product [Rotaria sordida]|uniref:FAD-binding domain-containing protein n=1 Tax=Rotaria sordida TaxID=392033 RepID=A0A818U9K8_9BILA|nr:unnamed protein product [Rotaria sordida]CAF1318158.1 unnamed protein product [Rotaria sordida]CAF1319911.1 unnamed protein product [Rotaria sordida]CAF1584072.1 unnamed protein product [Rotaria sordida]CAF3697518.1 unnamed protein product [Rotaria sordida]